MQKHPRIDWTKIERWAVYVALVALLLAKIVAPLFPFQKQILESIQTYTLLFAIYSLAYHLVRQLDRLGLGTQQPFIYPSFSEAFNAWLDKRDDLSSLLICAYTSHTFREFLWSRKIRVARVRLLLFYESSDYPNISGSPDTSVATIGATIAQWHSMVSDGRIREFEVRRRRTNASFFFGIADGKVMIEGQLWPRVSLGGLEPKQTAVLSSEGAAMRERISIYTSWFEEMWAVAEKI
jgi:hypothetical protein